MAETLAARGPPKSFAQHLLEIEREAARAATRVRGANARASLSFAEPPFSSSGGRAPTPRREGRPASSSSSSSVGEERLARAEATRRRAVCETLVLRRTLPDLEMELEGCMALLRLSVNEKGHMNERAEQLHTALLAAQEVEARLVAEVQQLKTANVNLMQRLARVELGASTPASQTPLVGATTASPVSRAACINSAAACVPAPQVSQQQNSSALPSAPPTITRAATTQLSATGCATSATCDSTSGASVASTALPAAAPPTHAPSVRALPEQEDILRAAVTLALLEAKLKPGSVAASRPEDAALAAAVAAAGQMAASPPVDNAKRATWVAYASSVQSSAANSAAVVDALRRAPRWVEVTVTGAEALVGVDLTQLEQLLRSVVNDGTNAAVRDLQARAAVDGSAGVSELAASDAASRVLSSLRAASTAIQDQLRENLMASLKQQGGVDGCPEVLLRRLCARSVAAQCEDLGELVTHDELKAQILETVRGVGSVARALRMLGPQHWLESIVLGDTPEPVVEEPTVDFITTQVSQAGVNVGVTPPRDLGLPALAGRALVGYQFRRAGRLPATHLGGLYSMIRPRTLPPMSTLSPCLTPHTSSWPCLTALFQALASF